MNDAPIICLVQLGTVNHTILVPQDEDEDPIKFYSSFSTLAEDCVRIAKSYGNYNIMLIAPDGFAEEIKQEINQLEPKINVI